MPNTVASRSMLWSLIESVGLSLLSLAVLLLVARIAGPHELGAFAIALGIVQILTLVVEMLVHDAIIQRSTVTPEHLHSGFWACLILGVVLCLVCWLVAPWVGAFFGSGDVASLLSITSLALIFSGVGCVPVALLRRELRFRPLALRSLGGRIFAAIVAVGMVMADYGIWSLVAQYLVQVSAGAILVWTASTWRPARSFSLTKLRELVGFGALSITTRVVWIGGSQILVLLVGNLFGMAAVGYLNIAQRIVDTLYSLLAGAAHNIALPLFSRRQDDSNALSRAYTQATEFAILITTPLYCGLAVCAAPIISVLLGETWLPSMPLVWVLSAGAALQFLFMFGPATLTAVGRPSIVLIFSLCELGFFLGSFYLIQPTSVFSAAVLWALRGIVAAPLMHFTICHILQSSPWTLVKVVMIPIAATAAMAGMLILVDQVGLLDTSAMTKLLILIPIGVITYAVALAWAGRNAFRRLIDFGLSAFRQSDLEYK